MGLLNLFKTKGPPIDPALKQFALDLKQLALEAFPDGFTQECAEGDRVHSILKGKLDKDEARLLWSQTKRLYILSDDRSLERLADYMMRKSEKLTNEDCRALYKYLHETRRHVFSDGDGETLESAVKIFATDSAQGIKAEYEWLSRFGKRDVAWSVDMQVLLHDDDDKCQFDSFNLKMKDGSTTSVHFDISSFYGRF